MMMPTMPAMMVMMVVMMMAVMIHAVLEMPTMMMMVMVVVVAAVNAVHVDTLQLAFCLAGLGWSVHSPLFETAALTLSPDCWSAFTPIQEKPRVVDFY